MHNWDKKYSRATRQLMIKKIYLIYFKIFWIDQYFQMSQILSNCYQAQGIIRNLKTKNTMRILIKRHLKYFVLLFHIIRYELWTFSR